MKIIARIYNDYNEKFGIPRQSGLVNEVKSIIVFEPEYRSENALRGIEGYSHLWLIWQFSDCADKEWHPTVRPPRLGGNKRVGVFATRSPFRPNPIGLSSVKLDEVKKTKEFGMVLVVSGADLKNMTPIYDVKPYISYTDAHPDATCGFADDVFGYSVSVEYEEDALKVIEKEKREALIKILENDPRPSYQEDENRIYTLDFAEYVVKFKVRGKALKIIELAKKEK